MTMSGIMHIKARLLVFGNQDRLRVPSDGPALSPPGRKEWTLELCAGRCRRCERE